ncbi:primosomal replication protein N [Nitrosomonas ureae]|uniref:Replication restart protein PriB n=2 Tax=Nitrosomonas ureae TaxID=44577 RepID=A0A0S3AGI2_9PROT|nr:primosomal replication protein N [Nitrosomonas ureae]ALQ50287.1 prepilin peptidase [Nitrosomonas ureae]SOD17270.1 restart primosome assembly protein PriB [Nitrosomonas ureae]
MECNQTTICGKIAKLGILRYTPAGTAVIEFTVSHGSRQKEAGVMRQIVFDVPVVVMGEQALTVAEFEINSRVRLTGFLNKKNHMNQQLVLHSDQIELI